jgi:hypothetical protein
MLISRHVLVGVCVVALSQSVLAVTPPFTVVGKQIFDAEGNTVVFKGIGTIAVLAYRCRRAALL